MPASAASLWLRTHAANISTASITVSKRTRLAIQTRTPTIEAFARLVGRLLMEVSESGRALTQARRAIFVDAANDAVLRDEIERAQEEIISWMGPLLAELGSSHPSRDVHHLLALMDGLAGNQLVSPMPDFDPTTPVAALLHGLIDD